HQNGGGAPPPPSSWKNSYVPAYSNGKSNGQPLEPLAVQPKTDVTQTQERGQWASKWEFIFSCIGLSVGIGNVWRFPYLAYENGGGAFLIPYVIILFLVGKPMYLMETAIGQYSQLGPVSMWKMAPVMKGVGAAMVVMSVIVAIYYNVIMAYTLFFTFASFQSGAAPWSECHDWFADDNCFVRNSSFPACKYLVLQNITNFTAGVTCHTKTELASEQYFKNYVLRVTDVGLETPGVIGDINWQLALCLLLSWIIVFLCLMKGVKSSGKVVYVTATLPYIFLIAILAYGCTLPGAIEGVKFFFIPEWEKLKDINVWQKAAEQMFFSLSVSWGGIIMFGSYNKFNNKVHIDAMLITSLDFITSIIASVAVFSIMGSMAQSAGVKVDQVVKSGQGLAFIAFPEAIGAVPGWQIWSVLFFIMLFTLGLDTEFALLETVTTAVYDAFPSTRKSKALVTLIASSSCFLMGLPCVSQAGPYILHLMDNFGGLGVMVIAVFELVGIMWVYGVRRFADNLQFMVGFRPSIFWKVCWAFVSPVMLASIFAYSMYEYKPPTYGDYEFPEWAIYVGWGLVGVSLVQIPLWALCTMLYYLCRWRPKQAFQPLPSWGPGDREARSRLLALQHQMHQRDRLRGLDNHAMELERV
ncbi:sodium- and chloride-dependent glycine transporter 2-like, partial [Pollicipes pollicipes]